MARTIMTLRTGQKGCIQTASRRAHGAIVARLMSSDEEPSEEDEVQVEALADLLNTADFKTLRAASPAFAGTVEAMVALVRGEDGAVFVEVVEE